MSQLTAADGHVVLVHYTLTDDDGDTVDTSRGGDPLAYLHGADNIVPGLEGFLAGKAVGFSGKVDVLPEQGYGLASGHEPQAIPRQAFPPEADLTPGMQFVVEDEGGELRPIWVVGADLSHVHITLDHPLAGQTLHFDVEIVDVREATADEKAHGHPHGPGGHHH